MLPMTVQSAPGVSRVPSLSWAVVAQETHPRSATVTVVGFWMGCTAVHANDAVAVGEAVVAYAAAAGVPAALVAEDYTAKEMLAVYPPEGGWTVAIWPDAFEGAWPASRWLSRHLAAAVSAVEVIAGNYWTHAAFESGHEVDRYSAIPDNSLPYELEGDEQALAQIRREMAGNPARLAALFHRPAEVIAPYLVHPRSLDLPEDLVEPPKAHLDDEFHLFDCWVFVDFWRRVGITYPDNTAPVRLIKFGRPGHTALPNDLG